MIKRTTEVEKKIIKHHDIKEHKLDLDKYLYERTKMLQANQWDNHGRLFCNCP